MKRKAASVSVGTYTKLQALAISKGVSIKELVDVVVQGLSTPRTRRYARIKKQVEAFHNEVAQ